MTKIVNANSIIVDWKMPDCIDGELEGYDIDIYLTDTFHYIPSLCDKPYYNQTINNTIETYYKFEDIPSNSNYTIVIFAKTNGGISDSLEDFAITLNGGKLIIINNYFINHFNNTKYFVLLSFFSIRRYNRFGARFNERRR